MKKKLIGIAVATFGVALSVGSAIALYQHAAQQTSFGISAGTYAGSTGTITYKINGASGNSQLDPVYCDGEGVAAEEENIGVSVDYPQIKYEFALGGVYSEDLIAQQYVMGNLNLQFADLISDLNGKVTVWAGVQGYTEGKIGESAYGEALVDNQVIDAEHPNINIDRVISVKADGSQQKLVVWVKFANIDDISLAEKANLYSLSVAWGELPQDFKLAYIVGNGNQWHEDDKYAMVVNIEATSFEWMFQNLPGSMGEAKVVRNGEWCHSDGNHVLDAEKTYNVYWTAPNDANFAEQA